MECDGTAKDNLNKSKSKKVLDLKGDYLDFTANLLVENIIDFVLKESPRDFVRAEVYVLYEIIECTRMISDNNWVGKPQKQQSS